MLGMWGKPSPTFRTICDSAERGRDECTFGRTSRWVYDFVRVSAEFIRQTSCRFERNERVACGTCGNAHDEDSCRCAKLILSLPGSGTSLFIPSPEDVARELASSCQRRYRTVAYILLEYCTASAFRSPLLASLEQTTF